MIYITGDVHCPYDVKKLNTKNFPQQKNMSENDFLIVCGDMGLVWSYSEGKDYKSDLYWQKWFSNKKCTTLFVDGNHENFSMLKSYPIVDFYGGKAHKICEKVYHLMRGEVYNLQGKTFFCMGGASSHDKELRVEDISWWKEELPNMDEIANARRNLEKVNNEVDFIVSHCCSSRLQNKIDMGYETDILTDFFNEVEGFVLFKHWYFGHYHIDKDFGDRFSCLYDKIVCVKY